MPNCRSSSPGSAPCRLELQWRPSRWLLAALLILSLLAPLSVLGSELPRALAWPLALGAAGAGLAAAWREAGRAPRHLRLAATAPGADAGPHAGRDTLGIYLAHYVLVLLFYAAVPAPVAPASRLLVGAAAMAVSFGGSLALTRLARRRSGERCLRFEEDRRVVQPCGSLRRVQAGAGRVLRAGNAGFHRASQGRPRDRLDRGRAVAAGLRKNKRLYRGSRIVSVMASR